MVRFYAFLFMSTFWWGCDTVRPDIPVAEKAPQLDLRVEHLLPRESRDLFGEQPTFEVLISGLGWAEGPAVLPDGSVIVSDVENNRVMRWKDGEVSVAIPRSGGVDDDYSKEPGSNGLMMHPWGNLLLCRHGSRDVLMTDKRPDKPATDDVGLTVWASHYRGKRLNSPNDLVVTPNNQLLFTDPPYGLPGQWDSPERELDFCGVYHTTGDSVHLLTKAYSRPNGIGLSPDNKTLYLSNSNAKRAVVTATPITFAEDPLPPTLGEPRILLDATHLVGKEPGVPDGLCVAKNGRIFATAPGGVWVLEPDGRVIAKVRTGLKVANVTLDPSEDWLYLASDYYLIRIKTTP